MCVSPLLTFSWVSRVFRAVLSEWRLLSSELYIPSFQEEKANKRRMHLVKHMVWIIICCKAKHHPIVDK